MPALTHEQIDHFEEYGFLKVDDVLDHETVIDPVVEEYGKVLDNLATVLYEKGSIKSKYQDLEFGDRVIKIYGESGEVHNQYFDFSLPQGEIKPDTPFWAGPAVFNALTDQRLLDLVESLIGSEIYSNPVQHVRIKIPEDQCPKDDKGRVKFGATPWHQDLGVVTEEADDSDMLTVWFPLMDTDEKNGCLTVVPGSHKGELLTHCPGYEVKNKSKDVSDNVPPGSFGLQIPDHLFDVERSAPVPMGKGSVLLFTKKTVHAALPNISDRIRWSFDLRYNPVGQKTGRSVFPGFVARSKLNPGEVLTNPYHWNKLWTEVRDGLAGAEQFSFQRWDTDDPACA
jgi:hypothetical protein